MSYNRKSNNTFISSSGLKIGGHGFSSFPWLPLFREVHSFIITKSKQVFFLGHDANHDAHA